MIDPFAEQSASHFLARSLCSLKTPSRRESQKLKRGKIKQMILCVIGFLLFFAASRLRVINALV